MIQAIETRYKGYRFRSRLEARWAVFFDSLGLTWEYEPEGYDLGDAGWYLPDFRVSGARGTVFAEVKPFAEADTDKPRALVMASGIDVVMCTSLPRFGSLSVLSRNTDGLVVEDNGVFTHDAKYGPFYYNVGCSDEEFTRVENRWFSTRLLTACNAARGARFEHGERA